MTLSQYGRCLRPALSCKRTEPLRVSAVPASIAIAPGWSLVRNEDDGNWFVCDPHGVWVAKFWDGPQAGEADAHALAAAIAQGIEAEWSRREAARSRSDESPVATIGSDAAH